MQCVGFRHAVFLALAALPSWGAAVSLRYQPPPELRCPDENALRQLVAARLGNDPFVADARSVVTVKIVPGTPLQAEAALESPGAPTRRKSLSGADCTELVQSVAVTVALAVDPLVKRPEAAPEPARVPEVVAPAPPPPPQPTPHPEESALRWSLGAGASANLGLSIGPQPTLRLEGRARSTVWSLGLEGRFAWPVTGTLRQGALTTSAVLGAIVPCLHWRWLAGCADVSAGALRLEGQALAAARQATVFHASVGLRVLFLVPLTDHLGVGVMAEGQVPLTRATALVGTERVWSVDAVGGGLGLWVNVLL
jgi:hypothetical protein